MSPKLLAPDVPTQASASSAAIKADFGRRLQAALNEKGWNQSELARRVAPLLPRSSIARDNISKYVRGKVLPSPLALDAICTALGKKPADLLPTRRSAVSSTDNPPLDARDLGDGSVWLKVNQAVDWDTALQIMNLLRGGDKR
jgi:transcriptional regulator with XRE-family HTH domain